MRPLARVRRNALPLALCGILLVVLGVAVARVDPAPARWATLSDAAAAPRPDKRPIFVRWAQTGQWDRLDADTHKALRYAAELFPTVDYQALHDCVHSEGGHGSTRGRPGWHPTTGPLWFPLGAAGEHGPAQILDPGHWMGRAAARALPRESWLPVPPRRYVLNRDSVLGQAVVIAWGFTHGYRSHWHGSGC